MPSLDASVSEITAPTNASVIDTFRDAKKYGRDRGMPTLRRISTRVAPSDRNTASSSGSAVARPVATLTVMGKNESRNAVAIAGGRPIPIHNTRIGTIAALGTELSAIRRGYSPA